ncbi:putative surface protein with fasciclin (FAS1) repeats [Deinococcus sp. HSC-46F16]|uniref:fasciclin domain-containing protein n=1 Tax=Deinococcus sp. HSC-46F16 TaxID=2910968 RepID=UPI00209F6F30|nr:fasciclin domain-containing protein [Deinococcus sp. HSC-46F16]MCP2012934.1 putative surface protein with fasciclin (FAS1) repeats [Deinococcus sp. HSC-46F16]
MKKQTNLLTLSLMLATPALAGGAGAPAAQNPATCRSIAQIVSTDPQFSTLLTAVEAAGLTETLASGQFTVFAPTNAAFAKLPSDQLAMILNDEEMLRSVLLYHVVPGKVSAAQVRSLTSARTAQGTTVNVRVMNNRVMINNAAVTRADVAACNGVIHVIDTVLVPPAAPAAATPAPAAPVVSTPAPAAPVTTAPAVTAPAAFDLRSIPAVPLTGSTTSTTTTTTTTTETTTTETATTEATTESTNAAAETSTETETTVATNTLYDVIVADERFSTLLDLLSDAGLTETLTTGEYTIFAPTNEAFAALDDATLANLAANPDVLRQVLSYHVVQGRLTAEQLASSTSLTSVQGGVLSLSQSGTSRTVNASPIAETFATASNGTIFVINQVLLPPGLTIPAAEVVEEAPATAEATTAATTTTTTTTTGTAATGTATATTTATVTPAAGSLAAFVTTDPRFSILAELIRAAGLTETLGGGEFTLFAPTNDAFNAVPAATLTALRADPARLRQILLYHVVPGRVTATALAESPNLTTAANVQVPLTRPSGTTGARIGGATIQGEGIATSNGTVYIINTVLIPAGQ